MKIAHTLERTAMMSQEIATTICGAIVSRVIVATESRSQVTCPNCIKKLTE